MSKGEVLKRASLLSIESILLQVQLRWAGHVTRMEDVRMPKAVFIGELQEGKRDLSAPRKRYKDQLKRQLARAGISHQSRQQEASDRDSRRSSVRKENRKFETEGMKPRRKDVEGRKSEQHPSHIQSKPSPVQSAVGCAHQEPDSTAANEHARTDHQPFQTSSSARNQPSSSCLSACLPACLPACLLSA